MEKHIALWKFFVKTNIKKNLTGGNGRGGNKAERPKKKETQETGGIAKQLNQSSGSAAAARISSRSFFRADWRR